MKNKWLFLIAISVISMGLQARNDTIIRHFIDTITTVNQLPDSTLKQHEVLVPADSSDHRGHYVQAHVGIGYGTLGYQLQGAENFVRGSVSAIFQAQYAYYFHEHWGIGAGLWFTDYMSYSYIGGKYKWFDQVDTDRELHYDHTADVRRWVDHQTLHNIGIPISIQCRYTWENERLIKPSGLFASFGVAPSFSVLKRYRVDEGTIAHSGYYPAWNLTLEDLHEFHVKNYENDPHSRGNVNVRPQVALFADLGLLVELTRQIDLFVGGYANFTVNDAHGTPADQRVPLGWKDETFTFMETYAGTYELDLASASHPWEAGVKIGVHWHYVAPPTPQKVDYFEYFTRPDTVIQYIPRQDTIIQYIASADTASAGQMSEGEEMDSHGFSPAQQTRIRMIANEVDKFGKIYFPFDSYKLTNKAKRRINEIYAIIGEDTEIQIQVCGHASVEGSDPYNDVLSRRRAEAVYNYLARKGVDKSRMSIKFFGSRVPNEDHEREEFKRDRRVEVIVVEDIETEKK